MDKQGDVTASGGCHALWRQLEPGIFSQALSNIGAAESTTQEISWRATKNSFRKDILKIIPKW